MGNKKKKYLQTEETQKKADESADGKKVHPRERIFWLVYSGILFVICIVLLIYVFNLRTEVTNLDSNLVNCSIELDNLIEEERVNSIKMTRLERELEESQLGALSNFELPEKYAKELDRKGFRRPIEDFRTDLIRNSEIIPYKGTVKGKNMTFINRNQIYVISPDKVIANFGDGTNFGWILLEYKARAGKKVDWKILDSYCAYYDE
jgi:hypothetical protein